jgi:hypothetical protein
MLHRTLVFLLLLASSAIAEQAQYGKPGVPQSGSQARAQTTCPWLTQGSASRFLGGDASVIVKMADKETGSCRFLLQQGTHDSLKILVGKAALVSCPAGSTELKGIGNQAASCKAPGSRSGAVDMVSGRVRDLSFTVTHTAVAQKHPVKLSEAQKDALEQIAEQIAGNLY